MIDVAAVKAVRERTGAGVAACKAALIECCGDVESAVECLRSQGFKVRAERVAADGAVFIFVDGERLVGALVEINCETDFAAGTDEFKNLGRDYARVAATDGPEQAARLLQPSLEALRSHFRECVSIRRVVRYEVGG